MLWPQHVWRPSSVLLYLEGKDSLLYAQVKIAYYMLHTSVTFRNQIILIRLELVRYFIAIKSLAFVRTNIRQLYVLQSSCQL